MTDSGGYWQTRFGRRRLLSGTAAAAAGIGLAACSSSKNNGTSSAPTASATSAASVVTGAGTKAATTAATAAAVTNQKPGGRLLWATNADMNPQSLPYSSSVWLFPIQYGVYDYLTKYKGFTLESEPRMAASWEQPSPTQMTLKLRNGLKWHSGEPVTAQDIVFNFQKLNESRSGVKALGLRTKAEAPDATTVSLTFTEPLPGVFDLLNYMPVAHPPTFDQLATAKQVIGSGPFKFKEWIPGQHVLLQKNPEWWKADRPFLDEVEWKLYPQSSLATGVEAGEIDYTANLDIPEAVRISKEANFKLIKGSDGFTILYVGCNCEHPALQDKRVRQAINFAIDRQRIADEVMGGIASPMVLPFPTYSPGHDKTQAASISYDLAKAKALLTQAGYSSSMPEIPLSFSAAIVPTEGIMTVLQDSLKKLGVSARIDKQESSVYIDQYIKKTLPGGQSFLLGYAGMYPSTFMLSIFDAPNIFHRSDDAYKQVIVDSFKRGNVKDTSADALKTFNQYLLDESFFMPVVPNLQAHVINKRVQGFNVNVVDDIRLEELSKS